MKIFSVRRARPGFTLVETLLVITILGIVGATSVPLYRQYQIRNDLAIATAQITQGINRAKVLSQSGNGDSPWGFSIENGVMFKGSDYVTRDATFDENYPLPATVSVSGTTEVWFSKLTAYPNVPGAIIVLTANDGEQRTVNLELTETGIPVNTTDSVAVCHNPGPSQQTLFITNSQLPSYIAQGDYQGACTQIQSSSSAGASSSAQSSGASSSTSSAASSSTSSAASSSTSSAGQSSSQASSSSAGGTTGGGGGSSSSSSSSTPPAVTTKGLYILDTTSQAALKASGNAHITVSNSAPTYINSSNAGALFVSDNGIVTGAHFYIVGNPGTQVSGNGHVVGTVHSGSSSAADPLSSLPTPQPGASQFSTVTVGGNSSATLGPNTYQGITVNGNGKLTLNPGSYYIIGNFNVADNGQLTGSGVTIYATNGTFNISGNGAVTLKPPSSGTYAGLTLFADRAVAQTITLSGNGSLKISGAIYSPKATINVSGNGSSNTIGSLIVAKKVILSSNGTFNVQ